jgi:hypothetical protein
MDGSILAIAVTEKGGQSLGSELEVEDYSDGSVTQEDMELVSNS